MDTSVKFCIKNIYYCNF